MMNNSNGYRSNTPLRLMSQYNSDRDPAGSPQGIYPYTNTSAATTQAMATNL